MFEGDIGYEEVILLSLFIVAFVLDFIKSKKYRKEVKERANREWSDGIELTADELEERLSETELMYENLEETYWMHIGLLAGFFSYLYWHVWYVSILIFLVVGFGGSRCLAIRPFSNGIADPIVTQGKQTPKNL